MSTRNDIEDALAAVEAQRGILLENDVVDVALMALREKLTALQSSPSMQQHEEICVLVADMSGFTAMSEFMDAEEVRDTINAVWRKLDRVILNWSGKIDKHLGDGVIALFGMPSPQEDSAYCAVMAALDMHLALQLFNEQEMRRLLGVGPMRAERRIQMRIGVHIGPVYFGQVGTADEVTAVGDTVTIANYLEEASPVGGVLISEAVHEKIQPLFETAANGSFTPDETGDPIETFVVQKEFGQGVYQMSANLSLDTRFVGRGDELNMLQESLQVALDNNRTQIVTIIGDAGDGKTRLLYEFERLVTLLPDQVCIVRGSGHSGISQKSYGLIRSLLDNYFDIHPQNTPAIAEQKILQGIIDNLDEGYDRAHQIAESIMQLLGYAEIERHANRMTTRPLTLYWEASLNMQGRQRDIQGEGFLNLAQLFTAVTRKHAATILLLEDFHNADEGSYDFLDFLTQVYRDLPLLVVALARPAIFDKRPSWRIVEAGERQEIKLERLSLIDSRHMLTELLQKLEAMPLRLMDVIGSVAEGNPYAINELVNIFLQEGVLEDHGGSWQANMGQLLELPSPPTVLNLWRGQMAKLPEDQQRVLQKAAVFGNEFWDAGLLALDEAGHPLGALELDNLIQALLAGGWITRQPTSPLPNSHQYSFRHESMSRIVYEQIPEATRKLFHSQVASWLISQSLPTTTRLLSTIAHHLHLAENNKLAAEWYGRAAKQARLNLALETASFYYKQAIQTLPQDDQSLPSLVDFHEGCAIVLRKQARFQESTAAYLQMRAAAEELVDATAKARALSGEFLNHFLLENLKDALDSVRPMEAIAKELNDTELETVAASARGWLALLAGQTKIAGEVARNVYKQSGSLEVSNGRAFSRAFVGALACELGRYDQATEMTNMARRMFASFGESLWEILLWAQSGRVMAEQWQLDTAVLHYQKCFQIAQNVGDRFGTLIALRQLGLMAYYQSEYLQAEIYLEQALAQAEKSQNQVFLAYLATDLGQLYLTQAMISPQTVNEIAQQEEHMHLAERWFKRAVRLAQRAERPMHRVRSIAGLGQLKLDDHLIDDALDHAHEAVMLAEKTLQQRPTKANRISTAVAWRTLGNVLSKVPQKNMQATIRNKKVGAKRCYGRSRQLLEEVGISGDLEMARTLRAWALIEFRRDNIDAATPLASEARTILRRLGRKNEAERIKELMGSE